MSTEHYSSPSYAQQRLWFLDQLEPGLTAFNIPAGCACRGSLTSRVLERSLDEIVGRHEVLCSTFAAIDGEPVPSREASRRGQHTRR